jgi:hypothetical protein
MSEAKRSKGDEELRGVKERKRSGQGENRPHQDVFLTVISNAALSGRR